MFAADVMDGRLLGVWAAPSPSFSFRLGKLLQKIKATAELPEIVRRLEHPTTSLGELVLAAKDLDDLDERLEDAVETPEFRDILRILLDQSVLAILQGYPSQPSDVDDLAPVVGAAQVPLLREADEALRAEIKAFIDLMRQASEEECRSVLEAMAGEIDVRAELTDYRMPAAVKRALLGGLISSVTLLAIGHAVRIERTLKPWLARALCERARSGALAHAALIASIPGINIPESIVPASARLDLEALAARHEEATRRQDAALAAFRQGQMR